MLQKNRGESEILEMKKTYKIRSWEFPRGHSHKGRWEAWEELSYAMNVAAHLMKIF